MFKWYGGVKGLELFSQCVHIFSPPCPVITGIIGDAKQSRELFLETAKLVKKKNNNVEKFCYRRVWSWCVVVIGPEG